MKIRWILNRLRAMGAGEVAYRIKQQLRARSERAGFGRARPRHPAGMSGRPWCAELPQNFQRPVYISRAERILGGAYDVFASHDLQLGFPPDWNRDPKTGTVAPMRFGKSIDYRNDALVGDIKYLWEINRHLELVTLAQAFHLTGDQKFSAGCVDMLNSWFDQCPYPMCVHWTSSLELAFRLVNWSFAWHLLGGEKSIVFADDNGRKFKQRWLHSVFQHCHFISNYWSLYSSANNHLLGELLGLFVGAVTWPLWKQSSAWREFSLRRLNEEFLQQNFDDGVNREQAVWYHHEVADMIIVADLVGRANGSPLDSKIRSRLESMLEFVASIMDVSGNVPAIGDADDAVLIRLCPEPTWNAYRSLLATGAVMFRRADFKAKAGTLDDKSRWLLGDAAADDFNALEDIKPPIPLRREFRSGGYYILGEDFDSPSEVRIVADAGPLGYLALAAHGHADALSFTLSAGGELMLIDPGTYAYHSEGEWRDYFRGTAAHNTVRVDGVHQCVSGGNFLWLTHYDAHCSEFKVSSVLDSLSMEHSGYMSLPDPVRVRRQLLFEKMKRELRVLDSIESALDHELEIFWHFPDDCEVTQDGAKVTASRRESALTLVPPPGMAIGLYKGQQSPPSGWISRSYDCKVPTTTVRVSGRVPANWQGQTTITILSNISKR